MVIDSKPHTYALNGKFVCLYLLYGSKEKGMGWKGQGIIYGDANGYTDAHHTCNIIIYIPICPNHCVAVTLMLHLLNK